MVRHTAASTAAGIGTDIQVSDTYGKFGGGRHSTVMKFSAAMRPRLHTHTGHHCAADPGTMKNYLPGGTQVITSEPGSFRFQKGAESQITECVCDSDCIASW